MAADLMSLEVYLMTDSVLDELAIAETAAWVSAVAAGHATNSELNRRLEPPVAAAIVSAGFARHFVPSASGGAAGTFTDYLHAVAKVAEGDPSAAWVASIGATLGRMCSYLPEEGRRELWAAGPDQFVVGALMPGGTARAAAGGYVVSGEWPYMSGIEQSDWALVCCVVSGECPEVRFFVVPRAVYGIEQTWFTVGMRATGSHTIVLEDVFVPEYRSFARDTLVAGTALDSSAVCHRVPLKAVNGLSFAAPVLGAARAALALWTATQREKASAPSGNRTTNSGSPVGTYLTLARAAGQIDAAALLLERVAATADAGEVDELTVARGQRDCALAVEILVGAANELFRTAGTRSQAETSAFQRFWRDANAGAGHAVLQFEPAAQGWASLAVAARSQS